MDHFAQLFMFVVSIAENACSYNTDRRTERAESIIIRAKEYNRGQLCVKTSTSRLPQFSIKPIINVNNFAQ